MELDAGTPRSLLGSASSLSHMISADDLAALSAASAAGGGVHGGAMGLHGGGGSYPALSGAMRTMAKFGLPSNANLVAMSRAAGAPYTGAPYLSKLESIASSAVRALFLFICGFGGCCFGGGKRVVLAGLIGRGGSAAQKTASLSSHPGPPTTTTTNP